MKCDESKEKKRIIARDEAGMKGKITRQKT
jgi:hypothetical protein